MQRTSASFSPNSVTMPYMIRYALVTRYDGAKAYDLYETMNRQAYFRDNGRFRWDAATANIDALLSIRNGDVQAVEAAFYVPLWPVVADSPMLRMPSRFFFAEHGVEVDMTVFDQDRQEQEFEEMMVAAAAEAEAALMLADLVDADADDTIEHAHALWNLWDDGEVSQADTVGSFSVDPAEMSDDEDDEIIDITDVRSLE